MKQLNQWIESEYLGKEVTHYMLTVFDEYVDDQGVGTASISFKMKNGEIKGWYPPPQLRFSKVEGDSILFGNGELGDH